MLARRVQVQPLVVSAPARSECISLLDQGERQPSYSQARRARQAGRARTDDERFGLTRVYDSRPTPYG
jgi:hypothetical protein